MAYTTPMIEKIAGYSEATRGVWFGAWRDILKAKAPFSLRANARPHKGGGGPETRTAPAPIKVEGLYIVRRF